MEAAPLAPHGARGARLRDLPLWGFSLGSRHEQAAPVQQGNLSRMNVLYESTCALSLKQQDLMGNRVCFWSCSWYFELEPRPRASAGGPPGPPPPPSFPHRSHTRSRSTRMHDTCGAETVKRLCLSGSGALLFWHIRTYHCAQVRLEPGRRQAVGVMVASVWAPLVRRLPVQGVQEARGPGSASPWQERECTRGMVTAPGQVSATRPQVSLGRTNASPVASARRASGALFGDPRC